MNKKCETKLAAKLFVMTIHFCLWFPAYFCEQIVKFCEGLKVSFHYVGSTFSCGGCLVLTGISSALQRKDPWEERVGTDIWDRRYPLTLALSVCRASAFSASLVHGSNISVHWNRTGSPPWAGTHTSRTARAPCGRVTAGQQGTWDFTTGLPRCQPPRSARCPSWCQGYADSAGCGHSTEHLEILGAI